MARVVRGLTILAAIGCLGLGLLVAHGEHCIQRGARWKGFAFDDGIALVFLCDPGSGIRRAYFYLVPFNKVSLEKINPGA
jgi:hypothetical protein